MQGIPKLILGSIYEITPEFLTENNIKILFMDLDNTLTAYGKEKPSDKLMAWFESLKNADITPFIFSNNRGSRPAEFAKMTGLPFRGRCGKPSPKVMLEILKEKDISTKNAAIVGDQIYTDVLCGNRAGVFTICVEPISLNTIFRKIRYGLEKPYRKAYLKNKE